MDSKSNIVPFKVQKNTKKRREIANSKVIKLTSIIEKETQKQKEFDDTIETICSKCENLIDGSNFYGAAENQKRKGKYFFCKKNPIESQGNFTNIDPLTGEKTKTLMDDFEGDGRGYFTGKNLLIDEPALNFKACIDINEGHCPDYIKK